MNIACQDNCDFLENNKTDIMQQLKTAKNNIFEKLKFLITCLSTDICYLTNC